MNLWAHARAVKGNPNFLNVDASVHEKFTTTCEQLGKNKDSYFDVYAGLVENSVEINQIKTAHQGNVQLQLIVSDFIYFYYDGNLKKAEYLLSVANNNPTLRFHILIAMYENMRHFDQLSTAEVFRIFTLVKHELSSNTTRALGKLCRQKLEELQAKAPACLQLLVEPNAKFHLVNKFLNCPLYCTSSQDELFCGPTATRRDLQLWSSEVNTLTFLTCTFLSQGRKRLRHKGGSEEKKVGLHRHGSKWKVVPVDEQHVKLYLSSATKTGMYIYT